MNDAICFGPYTIPCWVRHDPYMITLILADECESFTESGFWEPSFLFN